MYGLLKKWVIHIGGFIILNLVFIILDGTSIVTNFNFGSFGNRVLQSEFYNNWLNFYENPLFNIVAIFAALQIVITALLDFLNFHHITR